VKTFAGGKSEKAICQALKDLNLPDGKTACIEKNDLPFVKFVELNNLLCPRTDIEEIYRQL
jgi:phosphatidylinositol phospholipase C, beta